MHDPKLARAHQRMRAIADLQGLVDLLKIPLDRILGDEQALADFPVSEAKSEEVEYLHFALVQRQRPPRPDPSPITQLFPIRLVRMVERR